MQEEMLGDTQATGDLKECFHIGRDVPSGSELPLHGPNVFPKMMPEFKKVNTEYFKQMQSLGHRLALLLEKAAGSEGHFDKAGTFDEPMAVLRLLHCKRFCQ